MRLTSNFDSREFDRGEPFPPALATNRAALAALLQWLRDLVDVPGVITSAWRSPARNAAAGGAPGSQHLKGEAVDTVFWLVPLRTHAARVLAEIRAGRAPAFGQIIFYPDRGHVHVSLPTLVGARNGEVRYHKGDSYPLLTSANALPVFSAPQRRRGLWLAVGLAVAAYLLSRS